MTASLFYAPRIRAINNSMKSVPGALMHFFRAGTGDRVPVYATSAGAAGAQHTNPVKADAYGEFDPIYVDGSSGELFQVVLTLSNGAELWREDGLPAPGSGAGGGGGGGPGPPGPQGLSVAEVSIFYRGDNPPPMPSGGSFNFLTQTLTPPDGWTVEIPVGSAPTWASRAVAAAEGATGTDNSLTWSAPVRVAADGSSVDIVFQRAPTQPAQPAPSPYEPTGWYTDVNSVPAGSPGDLLWSSVGTRDHASQNWIWQLPIQVEGNAGATGADASLYYIKPTQGTAIKNGTGQLRVEAHKVFGGNDVLLNSGSIQLYVGPTLVTAGNGFVSGSNGYVGIFDAGDIGGSATVTLKDGPAGTAVDTLTLVDVADGAADTGKNAVYGYIEASNGLAFVRGIDQTTWTPPGAVTKLDCTFVQGGVAVARTAWNVTRASNGQLTGAITTHTAGDLNGSRITATESNEGTQAFTVKFAYANAGDASSVAETVITSISGADGAPGTIGDPGPTGASGLSVAELAIYRRSPTAPATPTGGQFDFTTKVLAPPASWSSEHPAGSEPIYASRTTASVQGTTGVDTTLTWAAPVKVISDGASIDIVYRRSTVQPSTPASTAGVPPGWYSDVASVPGTSDPMWSSVGSRAYASQNWTWDLPLLIEGQSGEPGEAGADAVLFYIKPLDGTVIKNGLGSLRLEAHQIVGGTDNLLAVGTVKLYASGVDKGYTATFTAADIDGATTVELKDGTAGTVHDTISLVDVQDGTTGGSGHDAVYGYVEADGPLAWVREVDQATWTPSTTTLDLDCTFVQSAAEVARISRRVSMAVDGTLTVASVAHPGGNLNNARVVVSVLGSGTQVVTVEFKYSYVGDTSAVTETAYTSITPAAAPGTGALSLQLSRVQFLLTAYQNGALYTPFNASGQAEMFSGGINVTDATAFAAVATGCTGTINTAADTPVAGQPKGYYRVTAMSASSGTLEISATHSGVTLTETVAVNKNYAGYEIVDVLPPGPAYLFEGRMVYLTTDDKLYRYTGTAWVRHVDGADITADSITSNSLKTGSVTAAKISVTQLSTITAHAGTINAGIVQSTSGNSRFDLTNARIIYNSAPGASGGMVRVQGGAFGPTSSYLDWYGPKPAGMVLDADIVSGLTDANALYFLKTNGQQYSQRSRGEFEPKAWANFNGMGATSQTIRDRYNVKTIVRNGSDNGVYIVTFEAPLANANYVVVATGAEDTDATKPRVCSASLLTKTNFMLGTFKIDTTGAVKSSGEVITFVVMGSNVTDGSNVTTPGGGYGGGAWGGGNLP